MPLAKEIIDATLRSPQGEAAYKILEKLTDAGYDTWFVGGGVRDMLMGHTPDDIDIGTEARPEEVAKVFPKTDMTSAPIGSVRVPANGHIFEVTTFREDDEASDGRHPESVTFGKRADDAARRDITVNALYWNPISRERYDPFKGEADLKERLVRFIGDPATRIKHDALRILRVVRFRAFLDGQYHPETYQALREQAALVEGLSGARKLEEIEKILARPRSDRAFEDMWELGILPFIFPELHACKGIPQPADYHHEGDVWEHMMKVLRSFRDEDGPDVRLAALFHDCGKAQTFSLKERIRFDQHASVSADLASDAFDRLQMPGKRRDKIVWIIRHHMMMGSFDGMNDERKAHWYFHPWFGELLQVFWLDIAGTDPSDESLYKKIVQDYEQFLDAHPRPPKSFLTGDEVMEILGIVAGERVGEILALLRKAELAKEITSKKDAREFVEKMKKD